MNRLLKTGDEVHPYQFFSAHLYQSRYELVASVSSINMGYSH